MRKNIKLSAATQKEVAAKTRTALSTIQSDLAYINKVYEAVYDDTRRYSNKSYFAVDMKLHDATSLLTERQLELVNIDEVINHLAESTFNAVVENLKSEWQKDSTLSSNDSINILAEGRSNGWLVIDLNDLFAPIEDLIGIKSSKDLKDAGMNTSEIKAAAKYVKALEKYLMKVESVVKSTVKSFPRLLKEQVEMYNQDAVASPTQLSGARKTIKLSKLSKETQAAIRKELAYSDETSEANLTVAEALQTLFEEEVISGKELAAFEASLGETDKLCDKFKADREPRQLGSILFNLNNAFTQLRLAAGKARFADTYRNPSAAKTSAHEIFERALAYFNSLLKDRY